MPQTARTRDFVDQLSRTVQIPFPPKRIISLVPSQTELLFALGLDVEVVGITKFCIHPEGKFKVTPKVGGTKQLNLAAIRNLKPDLIIGNKEENERGQIEELMLEFPVWMSDINNLEEALAMIEMVGEICDKPGEGLTIADNIRLAFRNNLSTAPIRDLKIAYMIWKNPYMAAGAGTFIDEMIRLAGWKNAFEQSRYPIITEEMLREAQPDVILLSSEPYPFSEKHFEEFSAVCPRSQVQVVDGELFCWYGSRLLHTPAYLYSLKQQFNTVYS